MTSTQALDPKALEAALREIVALDGPFNGSTMRGIAMRALAALPTEAPELVGDLVLVPRERTEAMHEAAQRTTSALLTRAHTAEIWANMVAARPDTVSSAMPVGELPTMPIELGYKNYRGEWAMRKIVPVRVWWGSTEWHPEPQWLLQAWDVEKRANRDFALKDFGDRANG